MATISGSRAGEGETRASFSRRWLSSIMSAWVRRALRQMATRSARPATAMARNAAAKSRLMLGTGEGRSGAGWVMRPLQIGERAVAGQERRRSAAMLAGGWGAVGSGEGRGGEEGRSRGAADHLKKKKKKIVEPKIHEFHTVQGGHQPRRHSSSTTVTYWRSL